MMFHKFGTNKDEECLLKRKYQQILPYKNKFPQTRVVLVF